MKEVFWKHIGAREVTRGDFTNKNRNSTNKKWEFTWIANENWTSVGFIDFTIEPKDSKKRWIL